MKNILPTLTPDFILIAKAPLSQHPEIEKVNPDEFAKKNGFEWASGILVNKDKDKYLQEHKEGVEDEMVKEGLGADAARGIFTFPSIDQFSQFDELEVSVDLEADARTLSGEGELASGTDEFHLFDDGGEQAKREEQKEETQRIRNYCKNQRKFVICDMGKPLGNGLYLAPDEQPIEAGEIVTLYEGAYQTFDGNKNPYYMATRLHPVFYKQGELTSEKGVIDACTYGGHGRFAQDFPTEDELDQYYIIPSALKGKIKTANAAVQECSYDIYPVNYLVATRKILPGEAIGFSYGGPLWWTLQKQSPCLLYKESDKIVDPAQYAPKYFQYSDSKIRSLEEVLSLCCRLRLDKKDSTEVEKETKETKDALLLLDKQLQSFSIPETLNDEPDDGYRLYFIHQVMFLLTKHYLNNYLKNNEKVCDLLYPLLRNLEYGSEEKIYAAMEKNKTYLEKSLPELHNELMLVKETYESAKFQRKPSIILGKK